MKQRTEAEQQPPHLKQPPEGMLHYELHYRSAETPWMVFIHGAGGSLVTWKHQVREFRHLFNLLLIDMRDHGKSKGVTPAYEDYDFEIITDDILDVLNFLEIKKHERRPELVHSMIMAGGVFKADWKIHIFAHSGKFLSYFIPFRWIYDMFSLIVLPRKNHQPSRRLFRLQSQKLSPKEFLKWLGLYRDFFKVVKRFYHKKLETASLVVVGSQDHVFIQAAKRFAFKQAHLAQLAIMEGCGHICNIEQARQFNQIVLSFLRDLDLGKAAFPVSGSA